MESRENRLIWSCCKFTGKVCLVARGILKTHSRSILNQIQVYHLLVTVFWCYLRTHLLFLGFSVYELCLVFISMTHYWFDTILRQGLQIGHALMVANESFTLLENFRVKLLIIRVYNMSLICKTRAWLLASLRSCQVLRHDHARQGIASDFVKTIVFLRVISQTTLLRTSWWLVISLAARQTTACRGNFTEIPLR